MRFSFDPHLAKAWRGLIVGRDMPRYDRQEDRSLFFTGVYFLFDGDTLQYVGQSGHIAGRIRQHRNTWRPFTSWGAIEVPHDLLSHVETAYLCALRPPQNAIIPPGRDSLHEQIVEGIRTVWKFPQKLPHREETFAAGCGKL